MKLSTREKIITGLTLTVVIVWGFYTFFYAPKKQALARIQAEIQTIDDGMAQAVVLRTESEHVEKELKALRERAAAFKGKLSGEKHISAFLKNLAHETSRLNISIISLQPKEETVEPDARVKSYAVDLKLFSSFQSFALFLDRLKELPLLIMVDQFEIGRGERGPGELKATLRLKVYVSTGEKT
jgi:Tfp pilus assembly protein PilO